MGYKYVIPMTQAPPQDPPALDLDTLPEERLLDLRICDLPLEIEGTWLEARVAQLHRELEAKGTLTSSRAAIWRTSG